MALAPGPTAVTSFSLSNYVRVGRFDLPEPTRTAAPAGNLLAQEASAVTYNADTDTLFILGDGGTAIVQVDKTGQLINTMTLAAGSSPQGTEFYDPEGLAYIGGGKFVLAEERDRQLVQFTYVAGATLTRADALTVKLGTSIGNNGFEGLSFDPTTGGFIVVKEINQHYVFQTNVDFAGGTATNGSPTTIDSTPMFSITAANVADLADVYALSNVAAFSGLAASSHILLLSQASGKIVEVDRSGTVFSTLTILSDAGNPLSVADQQHEGLAVGADGTLYVVSENGGGDFDHPQLWVYAPSSLPNAAPTALSLENPLASIIENASTVSRVKVANVAITDDGLGVNTLAVSGADAAFFEVDTTGLYIKAGTIIDFEVKSSYSVTVTVDDVTVGGTPDVSAPYTLSVIDVVNEDPAAGTLYISEVAPWSSGNSPVGADWFEVTNTSSSAIDITGWKFDDASAAFGSAVALNGITSIGAGESVIFIESSDPVAIAAAFRANWFGASPPASPRIGTYSGSGVGLSTGGDAVNLFDASGVKRASVTFGASTIGPFQSFNNAAGLNNATLTTLSTVGTNGAFAAAASPQEIGSPGTIGRIFISEVAAWSSGDSPVAADWFELTNSSPFTVDITGWRMDDSSGSPAASVALNGIKAIAPGESVVFIETADPAKADMFRAHWFGTFVPDRLQIGTYSGSGVGLSSGGDGIHIYDAGNGLRASVTFGTSPTPPNLPTFDNAAALNGTAISTLSVAGTNGAFAAKAVATEIGSPGRITQPPYTLQLLHFYGESGLLGVDTAPIMGAMIDHFRTTTENTLVLAEGDTWIPGPWLVGGADPSLSAVPGIGSTALARPDIAILNAFGVNASALGNHEFDLGSPIVSGALNASGAWVGAQFPFITANLDFAADSSLRGLADATLGGTATNNFAGKEASAIKGKIAPYTVVTAGGERIGIVGATTFDLLTKTSPNGTVPKDDANPATDDLQEVAALLQAAVDALRATGVNKISMVDQLDALARNQALAPMLSGIDIMVAGGGHERLGDANDVAVGFNGHDASFVGGYPILASDKDGNPTLIVTTDTEFTYLGRLRVAFDAAGVLDVDSLNDVVNGAYASSEAVLQAVTGSSKSADDLISASATGSKVRAIVDAIDNVITVKDANRFGFSTVYLEGDRVFGRAQEVNLGNLTADANAAKALAALGGSVMVSLKNGGGLRASIGSVEADGDKVANPLNADGNVSQLDIENALRFDNRLMVFDTTAQGLLNILNYAAGLAPGNGGFPQVGGLRFSYDPDQPVGTRVRNVALYDQDDNLVATVVRDGVIDPAAPASIPVVLLNFIANGGDGYPIKANGENFRYLLTNGSVSAPIDEGLDFTAVANVPANALGEQAALRDFMLANHGSLATAFDQADTPATQDLRIENLKLGGDAVFGALTGKGTPGDDVVAATRLGDSFDALGGIDTVTFGFSSKNATVIREGFTTWTVTGPDGRPDRFTNTERLQFADTLIEAPTTLMSIAADAPSMVEGSRGATSFVFSVTRSGDVSKYGSANWTVSSAATDGATANDFVRGALPSGKVNFAPGVANMKIKVNVIGDSVVEADEGFTVTLSNPTPGTALEMASASAVIIDDDATVSVEALSGKLAEGNGAGHAVFDFKVTRTGNVAQESHVRWDAGGAAVNSATANDFAGGVFPGRMLHFGVGETSKIVSVHVDGDRTPEIDETFAVTLSLATRGTSIGVGTVSAIIANDDFISPKAASSASIGAEMTFLSQPEETGQWVDSNVTGAFAFGTGVLATDLTGAPLVPAMAEFSTPSAGAVGQHTPDTVALALFWPETLGSAAA
jgi:uncharacterized protein YjiK/2',3'-cyclic-nucleotide 2'-phosphodiesterase (5'-nucleotidase family)